MAQWWDYLSSTNVARVQFRPGAICELSLSLVLALFRGFFSEFSVFSGSSLHKNQHSKFHFHQDRGLAWKPAKAYMASPLNIANRKLDKRTRVTETSLAPFRR